jgi:CheY-like chemotaxis protein
VRVMPADAAGSAETNREDGRLQRVRIEVTDTGIGIEESEQARLFEKFSQADSSITRRYGGTGLGLAICRELAALMGGEIGVTSTLGIGSTFWIELPLASASAALPRPSDASQPAPLAPSRRLRVLVAEDNAINQRFMVALLRKAGHRATVVETGHQAVAAVRDGDYDIVLMDVQMPDLDGVEATRQIRTLPLPQRRIPIIALTAHAMTGAREEYLAAGMDDFVAKPIEPVLLLATLARLPALSKLPSTARAEPIAAEAQRDDYGPVFDPARLATLAGFMQPEQLRDFASLYLEFAVESAGRIAALAAEGDYRAMGFEVHRLVGAAGNAGALETSRIAAALAAANKAGDEAACLRLASLLPPATERAARRLQAWLADPHLDAGALLELAAAAG